MYMSGLVAPYFFYLGFEENASDGHLRILSRTNAMTWACRLGIPECKTNASIAFEKWMTSPANIEYF